MSTIPKKIASLNEQKIDTDKVQGGKVSMGIQSDTQSDHFVDNDKPRLGGGSGARPRENKTREGSIF